jgi:hypothetical protein
MFFIAFIISLTNVNIKNNANNDQSTMSIM